MKNGVPVGYGGGWPFLAACRIGINVFPAFRGGESGWLFAQVLRVVPPALPRVALRGRALPVRRRQPRGPAFRRVLALLPPGLPAGRTHAAALAAAEFERIRRTSGYRSPLPTMRALAASDLALDRRADRRRDAGRRGRPLARGVAPRRRSVSRRPQGRGGHGGESRRRGARGGDRTRWPAAEARAFRSLAQVVARVPDLDRWTRDERAACVALMRAKGAADDAPVLPRARRASPTRRRHARDRARTLATPGASRLSATSAPATPGASMRCAHFAIRSPLSQSMRRSG